MNLKQSCWLSGGIASCLFVWMFPWHMAGVPVFAVHMIRHMTLVTIAALCLVLGLPAIMAKLPSMPLLASFAEFIVVWAWHIPAAHAMVHHGMLWIILEQASFLLAGVLLWSSVMSPKQALAGAGALLLTSMHMTLLGALIILSPRLLYPIGMYATHAMAEGASITDSAALGVQQLGGMIMLAIGTPVYLLAGLWRTHDALSSDDDGDYGYLYNVKSTSQSDDSTGAEKPATANTLADSAMSATSKASAAFATSRERIGS